MGQGTQFVMCWGSASSGKTVCADSPFADYVGVWHMSEASVNASSSRSFDLVTLSTGTTYRVRATIANALGNSLVLEPDPFTTLALATFESSPPLRARGGLGIIGDVRLLPARRRFPGFPPTDTGLFTLHSSL